MSARCREERKEGVGGSNVITGIDGITNQYLQSAHLLVRQGNGAAASPRVAALLLCLPPSSAIDAQLLLLSLAPLLPPTTGVRHHRLALCPDRAPLVPRCARLPWHVQSSLSDFEKQRMRLHTVAARTITVVISQLFSLLLRHRHIQT